MVIQEGSNAEEQAVAWIRASHAVAALHELQSFSVCFLSFQESKSQKTTFILFNLEYISLYAHPFAHWHLSNKMLNIYLV